jgi:hypothetical protein
MGIAVMCKSTFSMEAGSAKGGPGIFIADADSLIKQAAVLARKVRLQYPGALYHLINRGDRRESIFRDDKAEKSFWQL